MIQFWLVAAGLALPATLPTAPVLSAAANVAGPLPATPTTALAQSPWDKAMRLIEHRAYGLAERLVRMLPADDEEGLLRKDTLRAKLLLAQKRYKEAEPLLVRLIDKDPALADRHLYELAGERLQREDYDGALAAADGVDREGLYADDADVVRVLALSGSGKNDQALKLCANIGTVLSQSSAARLYACGQVFWRGQQQTDAETALRYVVRHFPERNESKLALALLGKEFADYLRLKNSDRAFAAGENALRRHHFDAAGRNYAVALALAKDPMARAEALLRLADNDERKLRYEQAVSGYVRAASYEPSSELSAQALFAAGVLATRMKNLSLAKALYQKLLVEHPLASGRTQALFGLGFTAWLGHDYASAKQFLQTLLTLELPRHDQQRARYWYGRTLEAVNEVDAAQVAYSEILRDDPAGYYAVRADERLSTHNLAALDLPYEQSDSAPSTTGKLMAMVQRILVLASRAFRSDALHQLERIAHGVIPSHEEAVAIRDGFFSLGEKLKGEIVLTSWRYDHLGQLKPDERFETLRSRHPRYFADEVARDAGRVGLKPADVFAIVRQESRFISTAKSPSGARGLMQLMPPTAREIEAQIHLPATGAEALYKPTLNLRLGTVYLSSLMHRYERREFAFAAYNAGPGNLEKWLLLFGDLPIDVFCELIPFMETRDYVQRVVGYARGYDLTARTTLGSL